MRPLIEPAEPDPRPRSTFMGARLCQPPRSGSRQAHDSECTASYRSANAIASAMAPTSSTGPRVRTCLSFLRSSHKICNTAPPPVDGTIMYLGILQLLRYEQRHPGAMSHKYQNGLWMMTLTGLSISP